MYLRRSTYYGMSIWVFKIMLTTKYKESAETQFSSFIVDSIFKGCQNLKLPKNLIY